MARLGAELASVTRPGRATSAAIAALLAAGLSCLAGCSSTPAIVTVPHCNLTTATVAPQAHPSPPPVPASGAYFGAYSLHGRAIQQNFLASFSDLQQDACRPLDIAHVYLQWNHPFPTAYALALARSGHYLLISVKGTDIPEMASGQDDAIITSTARQIAQVHYPVFLEFRWEMDRPNIADVVSSPAAYIAAWDRMRRLFTAAGVTNASWVWCPTAAGFALGRAQPFYPGDSEVDWICADAYPDPTLPDSAQEQPGALLAPFLAWAKEHDKPVMIGEFGVSHVYSPDQRAAWLRAALPALSSPQIKAVVYFDGAVGSRPYWTWEIGPDSGVIGAFRALATDPHFRPPAPADPAASG